MFRTALQRVKKEQHDQLVRQASMHPIAICHLVPKVMLGRLSSVHLETKCRSLSAIVFTHLVFV